MNTKTKIAESFAKAFKGFKDTVAIAKNDAKVLRANKRELTHIASRLLTIMDNPDTRSGRCTLIQTVRYDNIPRLMFVLRDIDGFKNQNLSLAIAYLMTVGFDSKPDQFESAEYMNREYRFERVDMEVILDVHVKSDSPTCRRVAVGEKVVKQVEYKIECD